MTPGGYGDISLSIGPFSSCTDTGAVGAENHEVLSGMREAAVGGEEYGMMFRGSMRW